MKLTKEQAIDYSIELWEWMAKSGRKYKDSWSGWEKYGDVIDNCFLCAYNDQFTSEGCSNHCPLEERFGGCFSACFGEWVGATTVKDRKKYAKLFLGQLKTLRIEQWCNCNKTAL